MQAAQPCRFSHAAHGDDECGGAQIGIELLGSGLKGAQYLFTGPSSVRSGRRTINSRYGIVRWQREQVGGAVEALIDGVECVVGYGVPTVRF